VDEARSDLADVRVAGVRQRLDFQVQLHRQVLQRPQTQVQGKVARSARNQRRRCLHWNDTKSHLGSPQSGHEGRV